MSWTRAALCWVAAAILATIHLAGAPPPGGISLPAATPGPPPPSDLPSAVRGVELRRGEAVVGWERDPAGAWRVTAPAERTVPAGLLGAFTEQLEALRFAERFEGDASDPAFGLDRPHLRIAVIGEDGSRVALVVGERTPTGTAAYGRREDGGPVVLVGLNLLYYADLLFDAAR